jgi:RED-like protein N-terminal region
LLLLRLWAQQNESLNTGSVLILQHADQTPDDINPLSVCRDRADERRRGITVEESAPSFLTAEETRYLGGSMERTHLVRGLDRLLLNQVRGKAAAPAEPDKEESKAGADAEEPNAVPTTFQTALGRAVGTYLLNPPASNIAELFQPKRMAFVYFADVKGSDDEEDADDEDDGDEGGY